MGWTIKRIWSTDWFQNPDTQLVSIIQELEAAKTVDSPSESIDEFETINKIADMCETREIVVDNYVNQTMTLRERLEHFNEEVIKVKNTNVCEEQRLLSKGMIDAFLEFKPTTIQDFHELIPPYLRGDIAPSEAIYIGNVLEIIEAAVIAKKE